MSGMDDMCCSKDCFGKLSLTMSVTWTPLKCICFSCPGLHGCLAASRVGSGVLDGPSLGTAKPFGQPGLGNSLYMYDDYACN